MAQQKPEEYVTLDQVLKLVDQLSTKEQEQLVERMKLEWLRKEVHKGIEQANRGELIDGDVVFGELKQRYQNHSEQ
jgi:hypothetical protein